MHLEGSEEQKLTLSLHHRLFKSPLTTPDIKACVEDLKVLGKKDFKNLLKFRLAVREDVWRIAPSPLSFNV